MLITSYLNTKYQPVKTLLLKSGKNTFTSKASARFTRDEREGRRNNYCSRSKSERFRSPRFMNAQVSKATQTCALRKGKREGSEKTISGLQPGVFVGMLCGKG
jgi:hypothetical protein